MRVNVGGTARNVVKGYVKVDGKARQFWPTGDRIPTPADVALLSTSGPPVFALTNNYGYVPSQETLIVGVYDHGFLYATKDGVTWAQTSASSMGRLFRFRYIEQLNLGLIGYSYAIGSSVWPFSSLTQRLSTGGYFDLALVNNLGRTPSRLIA